MSISSQKPDVAAPDHLILAARDLDSGAAWLEDRLGVALAAGGRHERMGTHNRLLSLGQGFYLELIAIDPQPARIRTALAALGLASRLDVHSCAVVDAPQLVAYIRTPGGLVELD